jgi:hypothetical protein
LGANFMAAIPWMVAFIVVFGLYLYVRSKRVNRK